MEFSQNLKKIMNEKGISNYRLAKMLDVHPTTIKNWLENNTQPKFEMIDKIANALDVNIEQLVIGEESHKFKIIYNDNNKKHFDEVSEMKEKLYSIYNIVAENPLAILEWFEQLNHTGRVAAAKKIIQLSEQKEYTEKEEETTDSFSTLLQLLNDIKSDNSTEEKK